MNTSMSTTELSASRSGGSPLFFPSSHAMHSGHATPTEQAPVSIDRDFAAAAVREYASILASMPQLPASTSQLPPVGTGERAALEAAVYIYFRQLTIATDRALSQVRRAHGGDAAPSPS